MSTRYCKFCDLEGNTIIQGVRFCLECVAAYRFGRRAMIETIRDALRKVEVENE